MQGHDERARGRRRGVGGALVLLVAGVLVGVGLAQQDAREAESQPPAPADDLRLSLDGVFERARPGADHGDLFVQVRNDGPDRVRLLSAGTARGWRLEVPDATTLAPGASTVLRLSPSPACSVLAEMRSTGRALLVEAVVGSGRREAVVVDLAPGADDARLARLREPHLECAAGPSDAPPIVARDARAQLDEPGRR